MAALAIVGWWPRPSPGTLSGGDLSSVAVLPLRNVSEDPLESDYLAEGIAEAVITRLAQVGLHVTPWETARRYANRDVPMDDIARELNVDAVLSGKFQLVGDRIVTTLTLVETDSGFVTWADEFEEPYADLFRMLAAGENPNPALRERHLPGRPEWAYPGGVSLGHLRTCERRDHAPIEN